MQPKHTPDPWLGKFLAEAYIIGVVEPPRAESSSPSSSLSLERIRRNSKPKVLQVLSMINSKTYIAVKALLSPHSNP